jgi:hypothetical protein
LLGWLQLLDDLPKQLYGGMLVVVAAPVLGVLAEIFFLLAFPAFTLVNSISFEIREIIRNLRHARKRTGILSN